jgi:stage II sporulation protein AA (anti-sigma F factor antagonist)
VEIIYTYKAGIAFLTLTGRLVTGPGESETLPLRSMVKGLIGEGRLLVALDVAGLTAVDARGLGELVLTLTTLRQLGGSVTLVAPTQALGRLLAVTRLNRVLPICDSEMEAIASLGETAPRVSRSGAAGEDKRDCPSVVLAVPAASGAAS